jgi:hypothetical protein
VEKNSHASDNPMLNRGAAQGGCYAMQHLKKLFHVPVVSVGRYHTSAQYDTGRSAGLRRGHEHYELDPVMRASSSSDPS